MKKHQIRQKQKSKFKIDEIMLVVIVAVIILVVSVYDKMNKPINEPKMEAEKITDMILDEHDISFANNGIVDENKLREIQNMGYSNFKKALNSKKDFCIYIEDGNGNLILAKGSSKLNKDGLYCGE